MSRRLQIKICGMRDPQNIDDIARLGPDYMGFIFYEQSPRCAATRLNTAQMRHFDSSIRKVGVFVNQTVQEVVDAKDAYFLNLVQLHGDETPEFCKELRAAIPGIEIIKAFQAAADFDFSITGRFEPYCSLFLFDTAGPGYGGSGASFDWGLLERYRGQLDFLLSGGVGRENVREALSAVRSHAKGAGIDVNSKIETSPGVKSIALAAEVIREARV